MEYLGTEKPINKIQPVVSVCIQTYQHASFIAECLDSVLMQETDFPFEIIVGEDDSTDGTREICKTYAEKYPNKIRLFLRSEKDKIYINGKKTGRFNFIENLKAARGEYIALCDGDDYWINTMKLQEQIEKINSDTNYSIVFSQTHLVDLVGNHVKHLCDYSTFPAEINSHYVNQKKYLFFIQTSCALIKRDVIEGIPNFLKTRIYGYDTLIWASGFEYGAFAYIPRLHSAYRINPTSYTNTTNRSISFFVHRFKNFVLMAYAFKKLRPFFITLSFRMLLAVYKNAVVLILRGLGLKKRQTVDR